MKEVTEIAIRNYHSPIGQDLDLGKHLYFDNQLNSPKAPHGGTIIGHPAPKVVRLDTQMHTRWLPLSYCNENTTVQLYQDFKKRFPKGEGSILRRYFLPAKRSDWKIQEEIDLLDAIEWEVDRVLSPKEKEILEYGITPLSMDDKWFSYSTENRVSYYRSWTGREVYRLMLGQDDQHNWRINKCFLSPKIANDSPGLDRSLFNRLLESQIKGMRKLLDL